MLVEAVNEILRGIEGLSVPATPWKVETGPDSTGDDAIYGTAVLRDRARPGVAA